MAAKNLRRLIVGCDHGGYDMKAQLLDYIKGKYSDLTIVDVGCNGPADRCDYPDIAQALAVHVIADSEAAPAEGDAPGLWTPGILVCGSGIGISIAANKVDGIRCALCHYHWTASMGRAHNDANVMALGGRCLGIEPAKGMVDAFFATPFEGDRHCGRIAKIHGLEAAKQ